METFSVGDLKANNEYSSDLMIDNKFLVCPANCPLSQDTIKALLMWNFKSVTSEGKLVQKPVTPTVTDETKKAIAEKTEEVIVIADDKPIEPEVQGESTEIDGDIKEALEKAEQKKNQMTNDSGHMELVQEVYDAFLKYINKVYTFYATHKEFKKAEIFGTVGAMCDFIKEHRRYILRISPDETLFNKNFIVFHSLRSMVIALSIAMQLKMDQPKIVELGVATMLHEIGMLKISPQLYINNKPLTVAEKNQILTHPLLSYNILQEYSFSQPILLGVLDHHERENGSGYPRHRRGGEISFYARIIAVACSFEAITAPRKFRQARSSYDAMIEMMKNEKKLYDDTILKALLFSLSLYPIGAYVYLSNGQVAQVVDVSPTNPTNPIVQLLTEKDARGNPKQIQTDGNGNKIVRVLDKAESDDIITALKKKSPQQAQVQTQAPVQNQAQVQTEPPSQPQS